MQRHIQDLAGKKSIYWQSGIFTYSLSNPLHPPSPEKQRNSFMFINLSPPPFTHPPFFSLKPFLFPSPRTQSSLQNIYLSTNVNETMRILINFLMYSIKIFSDILHNFYSYETWKWNNT